MMDKIWQRITQMFYFQKENIDFSLCEGALEEDFALLESKINAPLPEDFKDFYRIHNGQNNKYLGLFYSCSLMPIKDIIHAWEVNAQIYEQLEHEPQKIYGKQFDTPTLDKMIHSTWKWQDAKELQDVWWHPLWIRFADDGCGNGYCLDLAPSKDGKMGQIIWFFHDDKSYLEAGSFAKWIAEYADTLENEEYIYSQDYGAFVKRELTS